MASTVTLLNKKSTKIRRSREDVIYDTIKIIILALAAFVVIYPLYFIIIASISDASAVSSGEVLLFPVGFSLDGYERIFAHTQIWIGYRNTIFYAVAGTFINVLLTIGLAYPLSRKDFGFGKYLMIFLLITMYFNGGLIPRYLVVQKLGLLDTWGVLLLINAVNVFNVIIARTFLRNTIPESLYEAAVLDGCTHFQFLRMVVMPLSKAIIAVLVLYYGVFHWNDFFSGMIYLRDENKQPLQLVLRSILLESQTESLSYDIDVSEHQDVAELIKYGLIIVSSLPVLMIYPFLQKYFVQGVMIGSVKG